MNEKVNEILDALKIVEIGIAQSTFYATTYCFFDEEGIRTFNGDSLFCEVNIETDIKGMIPFAPLKKILEGMLSLDNEIEFEDQENYLKIKCGRTKSKIKKENNEFPELETSKEKTIAMTDEIKDALKQCLPAISLLENREALTSVHVTSEYIEGASGHFIKRVNIPVSSEDYNFLVPATKLDKILNLVIDDISISEESVGFHGENFSIISQRSLGKYPDVDRIINFEKKEEATFEVVFPEGLLSSLNRADIFSEEDQVYFSFSKGNMEIRSGNDYGEIIESFESGWEGDDFSFRISISSISKVLKETNKAILGESKIKFLTDNSVIILVIVASE